MSGFEEETGIKGSTVVRWGIIIVVMILALGWVGQGNDFFLFKVFAPKYEAVRRSTFEESKAYNQGMIQELQNMQFEYAKANPGQKDALASIILHRAADYDLNDTRVPPDLRQFVQNLRQERASAR
jgi:hypothetical protein